MCLQSFLMLHKAPGPLHRPSFKLVAGIVAFQDIYNEGNVLWAISIIPTIEYSAFDNQHQSVCKLKFLLFAVRKY